MTETSKENEMSETFTPLTARQANDLVGRQATVTAYSMHNVVGGPHKHMTGTLVAYSIEPQVLIEDEHGEHTWWRRDMVALEKPEEPTGDRATVRDADGALWTKYREERDDQRAFACWENSNQRWRFYKDIDVVEVLFEGVQP